MRRITDKDFRYTPAASTNIRLTFARVRREMRKASATETHGSTRTNLPKVAAIGGRRK